MPEHSEKIVVLGGSGFIGRQICRFGLSMGHRMISVSRSGRPDIEEPWVEGIEWLEGDALEPESWAEALDGAFAVIHCVGIIQEDASEGRTFQRVNRDAAVTVAREAQEHGVEKFVFLSAADDLPMVDSAFLETKRDAEEALDDSEMQSAILRPGVAYGAERPASVAAAPLLSVAQRIPGLSDTVGELESIPVEKLAIAALRAALESDRSGIYEPDELDRLGDAMFIQ